MKRLSRLGLIALAVVGCSGPPVSATSVDLREFSVTPAADRLTPGIIELTINNSGEFPHTLVVSDADGTVVAGSELVMPGETSNLALDLEDGQYMFTCRIVGQSDEGELIDHYERGMVARVEVAA